jgi:hypothetical protein
MVARWSANPPYAVAGDRGGVRGVKRHSWRECTRHSAAAGGRRRCELTSRLK